jgi:hypothetical protein
MEENMNCFRMFELSYGSYKYSESTNSNGCVPDAKAVIGHSS